VDAGAVDELVKRWATHIKTVSMMENDEGAWKAART
jgi:hypothetical protein